MEVTASLKLNIVVTIEAESLEQAYQKFHSLYPRIEFENRGDIGTKITYHNCDNIKSEWEVSNPYYKGWD
jgi:hypothetical protein